MNAYTDFVYLALVLAGVAFCLASSLGVVRMRDVFCRIHASGMGQTLGPVCLLLAYAIVHPGGGAWAKVLLAMFFLVAATAVGSHIIGRAAYRAHLPMHEGTVRDEWEARTGEKPRTYER